MIIFTIKQYKMALFLHGPLTQGVQLEAFVCYCSVTRQNTQSSSLSIMPLRWPLETSPPSAPPPDDELAWELQQQSRHRHYHYYYWSSNDYNDAIANTLHRYFTESRKALRTLICCCDHINAKSWDDWMVAKAQPIQECLQLLTQGG